MRLITAFKAFFGALFSGATADRVGQALLSVEPTPAEKTPKTKKKPEPKTPPKPVQSEAVALLAALQREARLVDFLMEPIDAYSDEQVGTAVRDIHRDSAKVLARLFEIKPIRDEEEGTQVELPTPLDAGVCQLVGNVSDTLPEKGELIHAGWAVERAELPTFSGSKQAAKVVAPVEIEL